ncbi:MULTISPECIES: SRPBCC family protein [Ramlibacter]|nr:MULTISPECIES: SRPBCC family protein [Ramlibacter]
MQARPIHVAALAVGLLLLRQLDQQRQDDLDGEMFDEDMQPHHPGLALLGLAALVGGGLYLSRQLRHGTGTPRRSSVEESIELAVPVSTAYNQWTQFEEFPRFMASVEHVEQVDDTHLHWRAVVAGRAKEWDSEITEQVPDQRIAWRSTSGTPNAGMVTFHRLGDNRTRVQLQMDYQPETRAEKAGAAVGAVKLAARGNLRRFKELVEARGMATGGWRGTVPAH